MWALPNDLPNTVHIFFLQMRQSSVPVPIVLHQNNHLFTYGPEIQNGCVVSPLDGEASAGRTEGWACHHLKAHLSRARWLLSWCWLWPALPRAWRIDLEGEWRSYLYAFGKTFYHTEAQGVKSSPSQTARRWSIPSGNRSGRSPAFWGVAGDPLAQ